jgi:predicted dehydrogenase
MVNPTLSVLKTSAEIPAETDIRKVLDDKSVTAVVVSAPDHWHALATIWAAERGKHVYVEKPVSHNLIEGRRMVNAARKYKVVIQAGTQRRSQESVIAAREYVQAGKLGKVAFARAWIAGDRPNIGRAKPEAPPAGVDYNLWLGPASGEFTKNRFHYNWHWFWDLGTGELGNNGIHGLDVVRNVLDLDTPVKVSCAGGKYYYYDDQQTPDTQIATFDFAGGPGGAAGCTVLWEHRVWEKKGQGPEGQSYGISIHGDGGTMLFTGDAWQVRGGVGEGANGKPKGDMVRVHQKNFIDSIRGDAKPNAEIEIGHKSTTLCHLGNIAYRTGKTLKFDAKTETTDSAEANKLLGREYRKGFELPSV